MCSYRKMSSVVTVVSSAVRGVCSPVDVGVYIVSCVSHLVNVGVGANDPRTHMRGVLVIRSAEIIFRVKSRWTLQSSVVCLSETKNSLRANNTQRTKATFSVSLSFDVGM